MAVAAAELRKTYPPDVTALDGVSLAVQTGTIFGLLGPNGAGKSTTVRVLSTLTTPDSGSARVAGIDVRVDPIGVRHAIGVVGQRHGADMEATGRENLVLQGEFYGITGRHLKQRVAESLERFGLTHAADRLVKTYSGGMQRRLDIAMGLLHRPRVLFLDEPTTGLDPEARSEMWSEIEGLAATDRMTILLTTHYLEEADRLASTPRDHRPRPGRRGGDAQRAQERAARRHDPGRAVRDRWRCSRGPGPRDGRSRGRARRPAAAGPRRNGGEAIPAVLAALEAHGVTARAVTLARPSLDDVYLRHAGRAFDQQDETREEVAA